MSVKYLVKHYFIQKNNLHAIVLVAYNSYSNILGSDMLYDQYDPLLKCNCFHNMPCYISYTEIIGFGLAYGVQHNFNNILAISWWSVLLVDETRQMGASTPTQPSTCHKSEKTLLDNFFRVHLAISGVRTHNFSTEIIASSFKFYFKVPEKNNELSSFAH